MNGSHVAIGDKEIVFNPFTKEEVQNALEILEDLEVNTTFSTPFLSIRSHDVTEAWAKQIV